jgi:putative salt-induced outer membrane protein YdiY
MLCASGKTLDVGTTGKLELLLRQCAFVSELRQTFKLLHRVFDRYCAFRRLSVLWIGVGQRLSRSSWKFGDDGPGVIVTE